MSQPTITCKCCAGKGVRELPAALRKSYHKIVALAKNGDGVSVAQFSEKSGIELTNAHHHFKRLTGLGVLKKVPKASPTRYVTVTETPVRRLIA